jgi:WD40 repeat protein
MGIPILAKRGRYGAYRLMPGFKLPPLMFTDEEALALTLGLLAVGGAREPRIWDVSIGQPLVHSWHGYHSGLLTTGVAWSPNGRLLAAGSREQCQPLSLWDVYGSKHYATLQGHTRLATSVAWSPDGRLLASASEVLTVRIWLVG